MKKTSKTSMRMIAILAIAVVLLAFTACFPSYGNEAGPTSDPTIGSEELQEINIISNASMQVNIETAIGAICYADNQNKYLKEDEVDFTVELFDADGNEINDKMTYEMNENGVIIVKAAEVGSIKISATSKYGKSAEKSIPVTRQSMTIFDIILLGIGIYALYMGIVGKGKVYQNEFIKSGMEAQYKMVTRLSCIGVALCMVASGIVAALDGYGKYDLVGYILLGVALVIFIAGMVATGNMVDKKAKKEAEAKRMQGRDMKAPKAAFEFDENEPTVDDLRK